jgi:hypothetical protein
MRYRRIIAILLILFIGVAVCLAGQQDDGTGAIRHGKHLSRATVQAVVVRAGRGTRHDLAGHRRGGARLSVGIDGMSTGSMIASGALPIRSIDMLPSHWGAATSPSRQPPAILLRSGAGTTPAAVAVAIGGHPPGWSDIDFSGSLVSPTFVPRAGS